MRQTCVPRTQGRGVYVMQMDHFETASCEPAGKGYEINQKILKVQIISALSVEKYVSCGQPQIGIRRKVHNPY